MGGRATSVSRTQVGTVLVTFKSQLQKEPLATFKSARQKELLLGVDTLPAEGYVDGLDCAASMAMRMQVKQTKKSLQVCLFGERNKHGS